MNNYKNIIEYIKLALFPNYRNFTEHIKRGHYMLDTNRVSDAIEVFSAALGVYRKNSVAKIGLAICHHVLREFDKSKIYLDQLLDEKPRNSEIIYLKAQNLASLREFNEALNYLSIYIDEFPDSPLGWELKGICLTGKNNLSEAIESFDKALAVDQASHISYDYKGHIYIEMGKYAEAAAMYEKYLELMPGNFEILKNKRDCHIHLNQLEEALECAGRILEIKPPTPDDYLAKINLQLEVTQNEIFRCINEALKLDPECPDVLFRKGHIEHWYGMPEKALSSYENFLRYAHPADTDRIEMANSAIDAIKGM